MTGYRQPTCVNIHLFDHHRDGHRLRSGSAEWEVATRTLNTQPINFLTPGVSMERQTGAFFSVLSRWGQGEPQTPGCLPPSVAARRTLGNETPRRGWILVLGKVYTVWKVCLYAGKKKDSASRKSDLLSSAMNCNQEVIMFMLRFTNVKSSGWNNDKIRRTTTHLSMRAGHFKKIHLH